MATKTVVTSSMRVPVVGVWKCSSCGKYHSSNGYVICQVSASSSAFGAKRRREKASSKSHELLNSTWKNEIATIIAEPGENISGFRYNLYFETVACKYCGNVEKWNNKSRALWPVSLLSIFPLIIFFLGAINNPANVKFWIYTLIFALGTASSFIDEAIYNHRFVNYPEESLPRIATNNQEILDYAAQYGLEIKNELDLAKEIIEVFKEKKDLDLNNGVQSTVEVNMDNSQPMEVKDSKPSYCRKCGIKLPEDSTFCYKCGTKVM